eukprot:PhM_4_TR16367/c0_g1_i1/m.33438
MISEDQVVPFLKDKIAGLEHDKALLQHTKDELRRLPSRMGSTVVLAPMCQGTTLFFPARLVAEAAPVTVLLGDSWFAGNQTSAQASAILSRRQASIEGRLDEVRGDLRKVEEMMSVLGRVEGAASSATAIPEEQEPRPSSSPATSKPSKKKSVNDILDMFTELEDTYGKDVTEAELDHLLGDTNVPAQKERDDGDDDGVGRGVEVIDTAAAAISNKTPVPDFEALVARRQQGKSDGKKKNVTFADAAAGGGGVGSNGNSSSQQAAPTTTTGGPVRTSVMKRGVVVRNAKPNPMA